MPHRENRKIICVGKTSHGIILPKSWLRYYNLNEKDFVEIISNDKIVINPLLEQKHG